MMALEPRRDLVGRKIIGEEKLDAGESARLRDREPVEERRLLEHHAEIGGELRHGLSIPVSQEGLSAATSSGVSGRSREPRSRRNSFAVSSSSSIALAAASSELPATTGP